MTNKLLILSSQDVLNALTMAECIDAMETTFALLGNKDITIPQRTVVPMEKEGGNALFMPSYLPHLDKVGVKALNVHKNNGAKGLPTNQALLMLFDSITGSPLALMDGNILTAKRTGAISGLATKLLAPENAKTVALFGPGVQGATQLEAVTTVRKIEKAFVYGSTLEKNKTFCEKMAENLGIEVTSATDPNRVSEVDIICTATPSTKALFDDNLIREGMHINAVGAYTYDMCEIPVETVLRSKIVVDEMEAALSEAGELMQPIAKGTMKHEDIFAEIGEIAAGLKPGRETDQEITFFKSVGIAIQDLAAANIVFNRAKEQGLGTFVEM